MANNVIKIYDNGGATADRYTVVYFQDHQEGRLYGSRGMSENPTHPQGIGAYTSAQDGTHLGKKIKFSKLPKPCQDLVLRDLCDFMHSELDAVLLSWAKHGAGQSVHLGMDFDPLHNKDDNKKLRAKLAALGWHEHLSTDRECVAYMAALGAVA